jgi:serine phosphatase RsbU (regulator of sigma subunit)
MLVMLGLKDFLHLPRVDALVQELVAGPPGLIVVAGFDARPLSGGGQAASDAVGSDQAGFLPSGRGTIFGILARELLAANPSAHAVVVADDPESIRLPSAMKRHVRPTSRTLLPRREQILRAVAVGADTLLIDQLDADTVPAALEAARRGVHVLAQLDSIFVGAGVARHLLDLGATPQSLRGLTWVVTVQRLPTLCPHCRQPAQLDAGREAELRARYPDLPPGRAIFRTVGCEHCSGNGRLGDVAAFDFFRVDGDGADPFTRPSLLSLQEYVLHLVLLGRLPIEDVANFEADQLRRTYQLLSASERALSEANQELARKLAELEAANRVLAQRTESLISLQEIAETLISSNELDELARRIARHVCDVCRAERSILYLLRPDTQAEVLAVHGWDAQYLGLRLDALRVFGGDGRQSKGGSPAASGGSPGGAPAAATPFEGWPPGIPYRSPDVEGAELRSGLRIPLIAQNEVVGVMIVHSTRKARFAAGEVALAQALANQAALAIQRAGLLESLRDKIVRLEEAQAQIVQKERLERELELARDVQQSLLPRVFPEVPGYRFAARNETARQVGGDFYDVFRLDDSHFGLVIADVSDKGMPAALFMALTRSLLLAEARRELSPRAVLVRVHRLLRELGDPNMFVTIFYAVVDTATCTLTYVRAGHERPLLLHAGEVQSLEGQGLFLGLLDIGDLPVSEEQLQLAGGDQLVLYTDGLADTLSPDGQAFGLDRLVALFAAHAELGPDELCSATFDELAAYAGESEHFDDMTLLVMQVAGDDRRTDQAS